MGITAKAILDLARSQIGITESPPGSNNVKYNTDYYGRPVSGDQYPWCCAFQWDLFRLAGASELFYGGQKTAYCPALQVYAEQHGQWVTSNFKPGDEVLFDFHGGGKGLACHIGIVESAGSAGVISIEGNTSQTSQDNGGAVMRRTRYMNQILGAFRPAYATEESEDDPMAKIVDQLAQNCNTTPDEIVKRLSVLCSLVNEAIDSWETDGIMYLKTAGLINSDHDPREPISYGNLGAVLQRFVATQKN